MDENKDEEDAASSGLQSIAASISCAASSTLPPSLQPTSPYSVLSSPRRHVLRKPSTKKKAAPSSDAGTTWMKTFFNRTYECFSPTTAFDDEGDIQKLYEYPLPHLASTEDMDDDNEEAVDRARTLDTSSVLIS